MSKFSWGMNPCGIFLLWAMAAVGLPAQTLTKVQSFQKIDGAAPYSTLVQSPDGSLYGTTASGGATGTCLIYPGCGTIFKITNGALTKLHSFDRTDGDTPQAALVRGTDGKFYGTTEAGGANNYGTLFTITPSGTFAMLYSFCSLSGCADGGNPFAPLVQGSDGNFYGTTYDGGIGSCGCGTVFKITPSGRLTTLHSFHKGDGANPSAALAQGADGNFYGTTNNGGANDDGTIFTISPGGTFMTLHSFDGTDGQDPVAGLILGTDGNFYGTTANGGNGSGTIFRFTTTGALTTLHNFDVADGANPYAPVMQAIDGNLYGTTYAGGTSATCYSVDGGGCGVVFKMSLNGIFTTLYNFCSQRGCADGDAPFGGVVQGTDGNLYGTTLYGGVNRVGTVFSLFLTTDPTTEKKPTR